MAPVVKLSGPGRRMGGPEPVVADQCLDAGISSPPADRRKGIALGDGGCVRSSTVAMSDAKAVVSTRASWFIMFPGARRGRTPTR